MIPRLTYYKPRSRQRRFMEDFHPHYDWSLADYDPTERQIDNAFISNPKVRRLFLVGRSEPLTRKEWLESVKQRKDNNGK